MNNSWAHDLCFYLSWSEVEKGAEDMGQIKALVGVGLVKVVAFPWNSNPHILGIPARDELRSMLNKYS